MERGFAIRPGTKLPATDAVAARRLRGARGAKPDRRPRLASPVRWAGLVAALALLVPAATAAIPGAPPSTVAVVPGAGNFSVSPLRFDFGSEVRTGVLTVTNEDDAELSLQLSLNRWSQTEVERDTLEPSDDVVFFPRILTIPGGEHRIVRLGTRLPPAETERSYRLYLAELPPVQEEAEGATVRTLMRVGIPVFVQARVPQRDLEVADVGVEAGTLQVYLQNHGNTHVRVNTIALRGLDDDGTEITALEIDGWYVLAGALRRFTAAVEETDLEALSSVQITVATDDGTLEAHQSLAP